MALSCQAARLQPGEAVLEVGTGTGYSAAIASRMCRRVVTVENVRRLHDFAAANLKAFGNVEALFGDGLLGREQEAPFDKIILTGRCSEVPANLLKQLKPGGLMVAPIGDAWEQKLTVVEKIDDSHTKQKVIENVVFVPIREGTFA